MHPAKPFHLANWASGTGSELELPSYILQVGTEAAATARASSCPGLETTQKEPQTSAHMCYVAPWTCLQCCTLHVPHMQAFPVLLVCSRGGIF